MAIPRCDFLVTHRVRFFLSEIIALFIGYGIVVAIVFGCRWFGYGENPDLSGAYNIWAYGSMAATFICINSFITPTRLRVGNDGIIITYVIGHTRTKLWANIREIKFKYKSKTALSRINIRFADRSRLVILSCFAPLAAIRDAINKHAPDTCAICSEIPLPPERN